MAEVTWASIVRPIDRRSGRFRSRRCTVPSNSPQPLTKSRFDSIVLASSSTLTDHEKSANSLHVYRRMLMLICPICRNQNLDTAKFCGNCGNSFTRSSTSTSSLINCAQGHVYSAVYEHCPYCPQPQFETQFESRDSDFAARVETPITAIDPRGTGPTTYSNSLNPNDFVTRIDTRENVFQTAESPTIPPPTPPPVPTFVPTEITPA